MNSRKTVYKYFSIPQYRQEEDYLSAMHEKGWKLTHITFPGLYHFEACEPGQVSYRLDYNQDGLRNKSEYIQMFTDCGWTYLFDFVGYSYFRKEGQTGAEREEIFCDDASRLDMMRRVFRGRIIPLILLFALVVIPQLFMNTVGYGSGSVVRDVLSFVFLGLAVLYLLLFTASAVQFCRYEMMISGDRPGIRLKYAGIFALLALLVIGIGIFFRQSFRSVYEVTEKENGYVIEAERLNTSVVRDYDFKKGDIIDFLIDHESGWLYLKVGEDGKKPVFFGDSLSTGDYTIEITEDGHYQIEVSGRKVQGNVEIVLR